MRVKISHEPGVPKMSESQQSKTALNTSTSRLLICFSFFLSPLAYGHAVEQPEWVSQVGLHGKEGCWAILYQNQVDMVHYIDSFLENENLFLVVFYKTLPSLSRSQTYCGWDSQGFSQKLVVSYLCLILLTSQGTLHLFPFIICSIAPGSTQRIIITSFM